ncbi:hypothetical protein PHMEG_00011835 [Phytophthora megakarya]|uniref:Integrase catalytic domain-containing protein n=1 Tax=Phytophthora megakarya TaxID=4795 RepID=A0A225WCU9_9STRA|nr:hypothetical protein PHMEG_00011835 [Phytophthora megakarya]
MMLQAEHTNPVPYRPQMIGLVEHFHRTWKDCVATYMHDEKQHDWCRRGNPTPYWDMWVDFAVYTYNSGRRSTVLLSRTGSRFGRKLKAPNDLVRHGSVTESGELMVYHDKSLGTLMLKLRVNENSDVRQVKQKRTFVPGDRVWMYKSPRGAEAFKFVHQWADPIQVLEYAGNDNYLLGREDDGGQNEQYLAHTRLQLTLRHNSSMKARSNQKCMKRHQDKLWEQRKLSSTQQRRCETRSAEGEQCQTRTQPSSRVDSWWIPDRSSSGTSYGRLAVQGHTQQYDRLFNANKFVEDLGLVERV